MTEHATDAAYLRYQYGDTERLRIRYDTHRLYSEQPNDFQPWVLDQLGMEPGQTLVDVGCGYGGYHPALMARAVRSIVAIDGSPAMVDATRRQAIEQNLPVVAVQGDAQALPLGSAGFDRVMANHMLYHVPDQRAALGEMRRVLRPGGRVVLVTNATDHSARLRALHDQAARDFGYGTTGKIDDRFNLNHISVVREVFPTVELQIRPDAFVFPNADAALRYYASGMIDALLHCPDDGSHRAALLPRIGEAINAIIAREGVFYVPKAAGCFVAVV